MEAGNTILLHADLLEWRDDKTLEKQGDYGKQSERERKVRADACIRTLYGMGTQPERRHSKFAV